MRYIAIACAAVALAACNSSDGGSSAAADNAANATAAAKPKRAPYCFFKADQTKAWNASADRSGDVTITARGMMPDPRYKAEIGQAEVEGTSAVVRPIMSQNTGYRSLDNWWDMKFTIPNSASVTSVTVKCGEKTIAELEVRRSK